MLCTFLRFCIIPQEQWRAIECEWSQFSHPVLMIVFVDTENYDNIHIEMNMLQNLVNNNIEQYLDIFNARRKCKMITKMESFIKSIFCNFFHDHYCFYFIPDCINFLSLLFFNLLSVNIVSIIFSGQQPLNVTSKLDCQC